VACIHICCLAVPVARGIRMVHACTGPVPRARLCMLHQAKSAQSNGHKKSRSWEACLHSLIAPLSCGQWQERLAAVQASPRGSRTVANSCFANAMLQCLFTCSPFLRYFLRLSHRNGCPLAAKGAWCFICAIEELVRTQPAKQPVNPKVCTPNRVCRLKPRWISSSASSEPSACLGSTSNIQ
jgi:Ubiquitin carboxyl-terminal hydrolase